MGMNLWMSCPRSITATCWVTELHISGAGYQMFLFSFPCFGLVSITYLYIWADIWFWLSLHHLICLFVFFVLYSEKCIHKKIHCDFLFPCKCLRIPKKDFKQSEKCLTLFTLCVSFLEIPFWAICDLTPRRSINSWNIKNERRHHKPEADFQIAYFIHPTIRKPSSISSRQERIIKRKIHVLKCQWSYNP